MRIAICDDEPAQLALVLNSTQRYFNEKNAEIFTFSNAEQLLMDEQTLFDLALLDIQMKTMDGITLAKKLRERNPALELIFITGLIDHIYEGFAMNAINYLLKPFDETQLHACLQKAELNLQNQARMLLVNAGGELLKLPLFEILRIEGDGQYIQIITQKERYRIKKTMNEITQETGADFYRLSRSDLISLQAIKRITSKELVLLDDTTIPIPKGKHNGISEAFMRYHFKENRL